MSTVINNNQLFKAIYSAQLSLIMEYHKLEMVPSIDLDLSTKESRRFIKETVGNLVEELGEADEYQVRLVELLVKPDLMSSYPNSLMDAYSEELADVLHFMVELMIYSKIEPEDAIEYYRIKCQEQNISAIMADDLLTVGLRYARHLNAFENQMICEAKLSARRILTEQEYEISHSAGYILHPEVARFAGDYSWQITKTLNLATNFLKNKPWVQGERPFINLPEFQRKVMEAFVLLMGLYDLVGWEIKGVYQYYMTKNEKNHNRIINKY